MCFSEATYVISFSCYFLLYACYYARFTHANGRNVVTVPAVATATQVQGVSPCPKPILHPLPPETSPSSPAMITRTTPTRRESGQRRSGASCTTLGRGMIP